MGLNVVQPGRVIPERVLGLMSWILTWNSWLSGREGSERLEVVAMIVCELKKKWESGGEKEMMGDI